MEIEGRRCFFIFNDSAKKDVAGYIQNSDRNSLNVNASVLINEIKQLKAFINNSN